MKHPFKITLLLILLFVVAQLVGLWFIDKAVTPVVGANGIVVLEHGTTAIGDRPALQGYQSFLYLLFGVLIGTVLLLILARFHQRKMWKIWFFLAVFLAQAVAFGVIFSDWFAYTLAFLLALWKVARPNPWVHNLTEIFMYAGIGVLLVPIFDPFWAVILLVAIALYDIIAVWKTKHMVSLAEFQTKSSVFAGMMVPKESSKVSEESRRTIAKVKSNSSKKIVAPPNPTIHKKRGGVAILGGGDVAFPLIFAGTILESLIKSGLSQTMAFLFVLPVTLFGTIALAFLFFYSKKGRFYPAMPFLALGSLIGWVVTLSLQFILFS